MQDLQTELTNAVRIGIASAVKDRLSAGYALDKMLQDALAGETLNIKTLLLESVQSTLKDDEFREQIRKAVRSKLAKTLIERFGGEMERQINALKSDPMTRARITTAIEEIVTQQTAKGS